MQTLVYLSLCPSEVDSVLSHLKTRSSNTTSVNSLARSEELLSLDELVNSLSCTSHVRNLSYAQCLVGEEHVCVSSTELVLGSARQSDVNLNLPWLLASNELSFWIFLSVWCTNVVTA